MLRSDYMKIEHGKQVKKSGLTALQKWKLEHLSYLKPYYKQGRVPQASGSQDGTTHTSTDQESDEAMSYRGRDSSSSATPRKKTPEKLPSTSSSSPVGKALKKRIRDAEEKTSHLNELMSVMKESASQLVQSRPTNIQERERESFFTWLNDFTSRMPRRNWRDFQQRTVALAMEFTPTDSPQANPPRQRIQQGAYTSQVQHAMDPPPRPTTGPTPSVDVLHSQQYGPVPSSQMVSYFFISNFKFLLYRTIHFV